MELAKGKRGQFLYRLFSPMEIFLAFAFYLNVKCIEYTFRIYIPLHIQKYCFIHFFCLFLKSPKAFNVSLIKLIPGVLGRSVNFKITYAFLCRRPVFSDNISVSSDYGFNSSIMWITLSWRRPLSYRNQFLYDNGLHHERVNYTSLNFHFIVSCSQYPFSLPSVPVIPFLVASV